MATTAFLPGTLGDLVPVPDEFTVTELAVARIQLPRRGPSAGRLPC